MIFDYFFLRLGAGFAKMVVLWLGARLVAEFEKCDKFSIFLKLLTNIDFSRFRKDNGDFGESATLFLFKLRN